MKGTYACFSAVSLLAATAFAQSDIIIKQHAKEIRDQNNVRQGVAPPSAPARPVYSTAPSAAQTAVQQSVANVRADLAAIQPASTVTAQHKQQLAADLMATAQGANKPSSATVNALAEQLASAVSQKPLSEKDRNRLLTDLAAVLNPASLQPAQMQAIYADIQAIFQVSGMDRKDAIKLTDAVKAAGAETRN
jgi:hypothetical protein